jgi:hypothetical protein
LRAFWRSMGFLGVMISRIAITVTILSFSSILLIQF